MMEQLIKHTNEMFPYVRPYCSTLYSSDDLKEFEINFTPIDISGLPQNEGVVYFYHGEEETEIKKIEKDNPHCFFSPLNNNNYIEFLTTANKLTRNKKNLDLLQQNLEELLKNEKKLTHLLKRENIEKINQKIISQYLESDPSVFYAVDTEELISNIKKVFGKKIKSLQLQELEDLDEVNELHFPLFVGKKIFVLNLELKKIDEYEEIFLKSMIYYWINRFLLLTRECDKGSSGNTLWEKIFSTIPLPMALISDSGEILLHNKQFVDLHLLPSECLNMKTGEKVQLENISYFLDRFNLNDKVFDREDHVSLYFFRAISNDSESLDSGRIQKISSKELGIISSSIAHELNNPLGGVMAAISLLELDTWSEENRQHLADMKESAKRCRDLIEIFLGFSKVSKNASKTCSLEEAIKQSLNMLRFRMIESNLRFELTYEIEESLDLDVNFSTSTMLFYLIFGEVLTAVHHGMLIAPRSNKLIKAKYQETSSSAAILFEDSISYQKDLLESKLLRYLIDTENLNVEITENAIVITEWKLT
jgi:hypothetical protein